MLSVMGTCQVTLIAIRRQRPLKLPLCTVRADYALVMALRPRCLPTQRPVVQSAVFKPARRRLFGKRGIHIGAKAAGGFATDCRPGSLVHARTDRRSAATA